MRNTSVAALLVVSAMSLSASTLQTSQASQATPSAQPQPAQPADVGGAQALLAEAKRLFDALDYEQALVRLDTLVMQLDARRAEPASARLLAQALELRGRTRFGLGRADQAREDFHALLTLSPDYQLGEEVSPRVVALYRQIQGELIGRVLLTIEPADAVARIDGKPSGPLGEPWEVLAGPHVLAIVRGGYRTETRDLIVDAGRTLELKIVMERSSAIIAIESSQPGAEVLVDGVSKGKTESTPFLVPDLQPGAHSVELQKPCFETARQTVTIDQLGDYRVGPVVLKPALGTIRAGSSLSADVYLDGERRGGAPQTLDKVCAGPHIVEARTSSGRDVKRVELHTGETLDVTLSPRPTVALLTNAGVLAGADVDEWRTRVERALEGAGKVLVLAPPQAEVRRAEGAQRAPAGWLAVVPGQPAARGDRDAETRRDLSARLSRALGVQGVAAITRSPSQPGTVWLALLAAGAAEPDVIALSTERPAEALKQLDAASLGGASLLQRSLNLPLVEVLDRPGPVVLEPRGALLPGDIVTAVNGQPVAGEQDVRRLLDAIGAVRTVSIKARSRAGVDKTADLPILSGPRLPGLSPDVVSPNLLLLDLRLRAAEATGLDAVALRLNLAALLIRLGAFSDALATLDEVATEASGPTAAARAYIRGEALNALGRGSEARAAWDAAVKASADVPTAGPDPTIAELAAHRLRPAAARPPQP